MSVTIFPAPREARFGKKTIDLSGAAWIRLDPAASLRLKRHVLALADLSGDLVGGPVTATAGDPAAGKVLCTVSLGARGVPGEGYRLTAGADGTRLEAADEPGAFRGLQTLEQVLAQSGNQLPEMEIEDSPDFPRRGIMIDVSRCKVPTVDTLCEVVDLMARLKLNELQLYTEHTFAFSEHEAVWHDASPLTAADILFLDAYCRDRYIDLVPNQNSFGHFERWLRHPEYRKYAECPDGFEYPWGGKSEHGSVLKPTRTSLRLLKSLYAELLPNFTSDRFNVGCDETWELGQGYSADLCKEKGSTRVYLDFLLEIHKLVEKHGRSMMFWGDIILHQPELIGELPEDVIALEWGYEAKHPFDKNCAHFAGAGATFYVCPGTSSWNTLVGRTTNALANLANAARNGAKHGAVGYLITDWGDGGHHQYLPISYPGYFAGAAYSWCYKSNRDADVAEAMDRITFLDETGRLGQLVIEMGKVCELVSRYYANSTIFNHLLFSDIGTAHLLREVSVAELEKCLKEFDRLELEVARTRPAAEDGALVKAELANAIAMARCGAQRGLAGLDPKRLDAEALRHTMQHIISQHEQLWLARNRPGGLNESSGRLRKQLAKLG